ncbi:MAG TPA: 2-dehydropantoate 2-reductase [Candidatus Dormibacteraeota bacterium]|nr:2-dehydropantoate 2-reductase [Candidatus Dormibacteraeota bacterium]
MTDNRYRVGIVGGGAVGLTYAACLANTADVFVKTRRQDQAEKIVNEGISLSQDETEETFSGIGASADPAGLSACDVVIITVKSFDAVAATKEIASFLSPNAEVVSLQNGLEALGMIRANIENPDRVFAGVTYIGGSRLDDRSVKLGNNRKTVVDAQAGKLIEALGQTKYRVEPSANIDQAIWDKMVLSTTQNALSAVTNLTLGEMVLSEDCLNIAAKLLAEFEAVAKAEGITFDYDLMEKIKDNWKGMDAMKLSSFRPSMWQDIHNGRRTEIDAINGAISKLGEKHGIPTPYNSMITSLIKALQKS